MSSNNVLKTTGVYVPPAVVDEMASHLAAEAGVRDYRTYFDEQQAKLSRGDPGAELLNVVLEAIVDEFDVLYDEADFDAVNAIDPDGFELCTVAAEPRVVAAFKDRVKAARTIQETDSRTVHTAIFRAYLQSQSLPALPTDFMFPNAE